MLRNVILFTVMMFLSVPMAYAQEASTNPCDNIAEVTRGKTQNEVSVILETCRKTENTITIGSAPVTKEQATEWGAIAKEFAEALGIAAREMGVAVNDFLQSPAGFLLAAILVVKFAGGVVIGFPFTVFSIVCVLWLAKKVSTKEIHYEDVPMFWGAITVRRVKIIKREFNGDASTAVFLAAVAMLLLNFIVWVNVT